MSFTWILTPNLKALVNNIWKPVCLWKFLVLQQGYLQQAAQFLLQYCVFKWNSIHVSLLKPGLHAEPVRGATNTCQVPNAGQ